MNHKLEPFWREAHVGLEGDEFRLNGLEVWSMSWRKTNADSIVLPHPAYPQQQHNYSVYEMGDPKAPIRFAASELSNGVWGFYVPKDR